MYRIIDLSDWLWGCSCYSGWINGDGYGFGNGFGDYEGDGFGFNCLFGRWDGSGKSPKSSYFVTKFKKM